ncbi:unnamed protein product [Spirodela intermedia]|uniref:Uncharacterized protein n=1 Tax=Spirodela intermedia TaxID=51605 RepID=A0A7I8KA44_SPIIN|nr:unnamed protein product [Spirodela intermedia]
MGHPMSCCGHFLPRKGSRTEELIGMKKPTTGEKSDITSTGNYGSQSRNQIHRREETGKENDTRQIDPTFALIETCPAALLRRRRTLAPSYLLGYYAACKSLRFAFIDG